MLVRLGLRDFALVAALDVEPGEGLCLLTGETGAGKSILVEAVGLLAGQRAESEMVRQGAPSAEVEGLFEPARFRREVAELLTRWSVPFEGEVLVRRKVSTPFTSTVPPSRSPS
jgi:DNA repair protein RecN (Recombination protein N)